MRSNRFQSLFLLLLMALFLALLGHLLWGEAGMYWLFACALLLSIVTPRLSPGVLMKLYRGRPIHPTEAPELHAMAMELSRNAGLQSGIRIYYIPSRVLNAFATGNRESPHLALTDGLLRSLAPREVRAVLAHEIGHIVNGDLMVMALADLFSRLTGLLALAGALMLLLALPLWLIGVAQINWLAVLLLLFAPNIAAFAQLALSRSREFDADLTAARISGDPMALASALVKLDQSSRHPLQRIFMPQQRTHEPSLLRSHPPTEERIRRLRQLHQARLSEHGAIAHWLPASPNYRSPRLHIGGLWY